jgi:hypothetical protein
MVVEVAGSFILAYSLEEGLRERAIFRRTEARQGQANQTKT